MKTIFEQMGGTYTEVNGYLLPNLVLPEPDPRSIGRWGRLHGDYLKEHRHARYITLLTSCKLDSYLADVDERATEMLERLATQMAKSEGITEQLKAEDQMEWVRRMNNVRNRAQEIVLQEVVYP